MRAANVEPPTTNAVVSSEWRPWKSWPSGRRSRDYKACPSGPVFADCLLCVSVLSWLPDARRERRTATDERRGFRRMATVEELAFRPAFAGLQSLGLQARSS